MTRVKRSLHAKKKRRATLELALRSVPVEWWAARPGTTLDTPSRTQG